MRSTPPGSPDEGRMLAGGSGRLLDRAVVASANGIVITDPNREDGPIVYVNPAFERMTGYPAEEVLGRNCRFLQGEDRDQPPLWELREALREGRECRVVLRNYRKDGAPFWNELHVSPVYDEGGRLTNFVGVQNDVTSRKEAEEERDLLLERERLARDEAVAARRRLSLLAAAGPALSASLDYAATLERITGLFVPELADWCLLDMAEEDGTVRQAAEAHADPARSGLLRELRGRRELGAGLCDARDVLRAGRPVLVPEAAPEAATKAPGSGALGRLEPRSYMCVPLLARGRAIGAVTLVASGEGRRYGPEDLSLAEGLAHRCALAVDNARLYGEQSCVARTLQRGLLPEAPEVPGIEIGVRYRPVGEGEVGGDFYDVIEARGEDDGWVAVLGDVSGKGVVAAAITALALYTVRAMALREDGPAGILSALNEALVRQLSDHRFCTAACVQLRPHPKTGDQGGGRPGGVGITVSRGGHPAPFVVRADGSVKGLGRPGKALGVFPDPELEEQTDRLEAGDAVVLYTDGVTEARAPDGPLFGEERLRALLGSCAGLEACEIAQRVEKAILEHGGGDQNDDLAVLVLRVPQDL